MKDLLAKILRTVEGKGFRLSILTDIEIVTSSHEVYRACNELREEIVDGTFEENPPLKFEELI